MDVPPTPFYSLLLEAHAGRLVHRQDLPEVSMIVHSVEIEVAINYASTYLV